VNRQVDAMMTALADQVPPEQVAMLRPRLRDQVQEQFVMRTLLQEAVTAKKIEVNEAEVDALIDKTEAILPEGLTMEKVRQMQGMDPEAFRSELRLRAGVEKMVDAALGDQATISEEEVAAYYDERKDMMSVPESVHARHILVKVAEDADAEAKEAKLAEIQAIRKELQDGADFAALAREKSDCPSAQQGGDLGAFGRGQMVAPFEEAAFSQPVGEVGDVVETQFGYHLILVTEKNQAMVRTLDDMRDRIEQQLLGERRSEKLQGLLAEMREDATIDYPGK
jgi:peptidyl-prolyl cis-trans isomerase C